jgi:hypothetical protein
MKMLVETPGCGFRTVRIDGLYPIGTPVPFATGEYIAHGKIAGYGQAFSCDGLPVQHYLVKLDDGWWTNLFRTYITIVVVHPASIKGSVQCDPDAGGCGCQFRMDDSVLHRWSDGELSWMCKECAGGE